MSTSDDVAPIKMVAGKPVTLSQAERQERANERSAEALARARDEKATAFEDEALRRIQALVPEWDDLDKVTHAKAALAGLSTGIHPNAAQALGILAFAQTTVRDEMDKLASADDVMALDTAADEPFAGARWPDA